MNNRWAIPGLRSEAEGALRDATDSAHELRETLSKCDFVTQIDEAIGLLESRQPDAAYAHMATLWAEMASLETLGKTIMYRINSAIYHNKRANELEGT